MSQQPSEQQTNADPVAVRRERGVLAQRAYRKRHATKFQALQEENDRLKDAIRHVSAVANAGGLFTGELKEALRRARETAGVEEPEGNGRLEEQRPEQGRNMSISRPGAGEAMTVEQAASLTTTAIFVANIQGPSLQTFTLSMNKPSYLDAAIDSIAGQIYRSLLAAALRKWNAYFEQTGQQQIPSHHHPFNSAISTTSSTTSSSTHLHQIPQHPAPYETNKYPFLSGRNSVSTNSTCVFSLPPSSTNGAPEASLICDHSLVKNRASDQTWWRASDGMELYLQTVLPPEYFMKMKRVLDGGGTDLQKEYVDSLFEGFAKNYKCFGDGPRWNAVYVKLAIDMFEKDMRES